MIKVEDYLGHRPETPSSEVVHNALDLVGRVNVLLSRVVDIDGIDAALNPVISSGWRPLAYNQTVPGAAMTSLHITGEAIDLSDPDGELDDFLFDNPHLLEDAGLWVEHPAATRRWAHLQSRPPRSRNRYFFP